MFCVLFFSFSAKASLSQEEGFALFFQYCNTQIVSLDHIAPMISDEYTDSGYGLSCTTDNGFVFCSDFFYGDTKLYILKSLTDFKITFSNEIKEEYTVIKDKKLSYVFKRKEIDNSLHATTCKGLYYSKEDLEKTSVVVMNHGLNLLINKLKIGDVK